MSWVLELLLNINNWYNNVPQIKSSLVKTSNPLRIGIISAAAINYGALIDPVQTHPDAIITAIAARSKPKAEAQITKYNLGPTCKAHDSYESLISDPNIDAIYIPLPNGLHATWAIKALKAGKHVLIEKPLCSNADEARKISAVAEWSGKVALEAFHWRFHPAAHRLRELVQGGQYGDLTNISATATLPGGALDAQNDIRFQYSLAGGACMDLTYVFSVCQYLTTTTNTTTGVDTPDEDDSKKRKSHVRVVEANPQIHQFDNKIDRAMDATFVVEREGKPDVTCHISADVALPPLFGFIPRLWAMTPFVTVELEKARIEMSNFILPTFMHEITIKEKDGEGRLTGKKSVEKCYVDGEQWRSRGKDWWTTYRYQLEAFVDMVRATEGGRDYVGPWMSMDESVQLMEIIDSVYDRAGLPRRGL